MQPQLEVDQRLLHSVARSVDDLSGTLLNAITAARSGLTPPPGSAAAAAARTAELTWMAELGKVQLDIRTFGADLVTSANHYLAGDQDAAGKLRNTHR